MANAGLAYHSRMEYTAAQGDHIHRWRIYKARSIFEVLRVSKPGFQISAANLGRVAEPNKAEHPPPATSRVQTNSFQNQELPIIRFQLMASIFALDSDLLSIVFLDWN